MKYPFKSLLLAATVLAAASCAKDDTQSGGEETAGPVIVNASPAAIGGEIILKLKTEASGIVEKSRAQGVSKGSGIDEIDRILNTVNTVRFERLFPDGGRFEERTRREGLHLWYYAKYDPSVPTSEMASLLSSCKDIEIIEYSLAAETSDHRRAASPAAGAQSVTRAIADEVRNVPFPFNESERSQQMQWHYNNTGNIFAQTSQLGADANVYAAWQLSTGNPDVIVAVVDQGVKYDHEDLAANMWVNEAELNGTPGVDDDGNGYVDDIYGYNFTKETGELDFSAELMHGTHVAGTIAAVNNNGVGVCGIAGGSGRGDGVKIMSCEILGKSESGSSGAGLAGQIRAIKYAADNGAVICQNSWGYTAGTISVTDWTRGSYSALSRAMEYFNKYAGLDENGNQTGPMAGGIVLFAAGNDGDDSARRLEGNAGEGDFGLGNLPFEGELKFDELAELVEQVAVLLDVSAVENGKRVGNILELPKGMGREDERLARFLFLDDDALEFETGKGIESVERLVQKKDLAVRREGEREIELPLHALGHLADLLLAL